LALKNVQSTCVYHTLAPLQPNSKNIKTAVKTCFAALEPRVVYTTKDLYPVNKKDVLSAFQQSNVMYQFSCHCDSRYVGCTSQRLQDRIEQHIPKSIRNTAACSQTCSQPKCHCKSSTQQVPSTQSLTCDSAIGLHLLYNLICIHHNVYDDKQFSILAKSPLSLLFIRLRSHFY